VDEGAERRAAAYRETLSRGRAAARVVEIMAMADMVLEKRGTGAGGQGELGREVAASTWTIRFVRERLFPVAQVCNVDVTLTQ
jgi:hypothetical protein